MTSGARSSARVLVIGGGIGGVSAAYHLAKLGVEDIVLLDRAELSSGTTWHSTGNMETYRADPLIFDMVRYAAELYPQLAHDSGRDIGWRAVGRVMYTDREDRWEQMRTLPELGRARGIRIESLSPSAVCGRLPIIAAEGLIGGIWVPSDARVNPTDAVGAFAQLARMKGVTIRERCTVHAINLRDGAVCGVSTSAGETPCDMIVLAAGLWSGDLVRSCGLRLPLHALEHQYLITRPCGIDRNLPLFLSFDDQLYGREEVGGLIVGSLDDDAIPVSTKSLPDDFSCCLLSERWEQFEPYMVTAMQRFPLLASTPVKMLLNGPESFTPDGQMLLGPVPGVSGLYACCGFNSNGMALAPAAGRYIAEWIVEGEASADVAALDVRRFAAVQSAPAYLRERVREIPGFHCRLRAPDDDYRSSRDVRRSPLHAVLAAEGAKFASINGWERALWLDRRGLAPGSSGWLDAVGDDLDAVTDQALIIDRSADAKFLLMGRGVREWLDAELPPLLSGTELSALYVPMPGDHGQLEVLTRVLERQSDRCLVTTSPEQATRLGEWLRVHVPGHLRVLDQTSAYACFELRGPGRTAALEQLASESSVQVAAHEDAINDSTVITVPSDSAVYVSDRLCAHRQGINLRWGGHFAEEMLRIARGVPSFGRDIGPATLIAELGRSALPDSRPGRRVPSTHRSYVLAAFSSPMPQLGFGARDVILDQGRIVGELLSRARLPGWSASLSLGRVEACVWQRQALQTMVDGHSWRLSPRESAWDAVLRGSDP